MPRPCTSTNQRFAAALLAGAMLLPCFPLGAQVSAENSRQMQQAMTDYQETFRKLQEVRARNEKIVAELKAGMFCSECEQSKTQIEAGGRETFGGHLRSVKGVAVPMTPQKIAARVAELDLEVRALIDRLVMLQNEYQRLERETLDAGQAALRAAQRVALDEVNRRQAETLQQYRDQLDKQRRDEEDREGEEDRERQRQADAKQARAEDRRRSEEEARIRRVERQRAALEARERAEDERRQELESQREIEELRVREQFKAEERARIAAALAAKQVEAKRLRELVESGVAIAKSGGDALTDSSSLAQIRGVRNSTGEVFDTAARLLSDDRPNLAERAGLIRDNAIDLLRLGSRVTDGLWDATNALATSDVQAQSRVMRELDIATSEFAAGADLRARRASPEIELLRSAQELGRVIGSPQATSNRDVVRQPVDAGASRIERIFVAGASAAMTNAESMILYRVVIDVGGGKREIFWTEERPTESIVRMILPAGALYYRGRVVGATRDVIYLDEMEPAWVR